MRLPALLALVLGLALAAQAPRRVAVAAAADLKWALDEVRKDFAKDHPGIQVEVTFGSSGFRVTSSTRNSHPSP